MNSFNRVTWGVRGRGHFKKPHNLLGRWPKDRSEEKERTKMTQTFNPIGAIQAGVRVLPIRYDCSPEDVNQATAERLVRIYNLCHTAARSPDNPNERFRSAIEELSEIGHVEADPVVAATAYRAAHRLASERYALPARGEDFLRNCVLIASLRLKEGEELLSVDDSPAQAALVLSGLAGFKEEGVMDHFVDSQELTELDQEVSYTELSAIAGLTMGTDYEAYGLQIGYVMTRFSAMTLSGPFALLTGVEMSSTDGRVKLDTV